MKVTYTERIERRMAWNRKMFCAQCGGHEYEVVEQLEPETPTPWYVQCPQCGAQGFESISREIAIARWKQL